VTRRRAGFPVPGEYEGQPYAVWVSEKPEDATGERFGIATGSLAVIAMLESREGEHLDVTPTGPFLELSRWEPRGILAALTAWTTVQRVQGRPPRLLPPHVPGTVY
jgi:hypothetical protein